MPRGVRKAKPAVAEPQVAHEPPPVDLAPPTPPKSDPQPQETFHVTLARYHGEWRHRMTTKDKPTGYGTCSWGGEKCLSITISVQAADDAMAFSKALDLAKGVTA